MNAHFAIVAELSSHMLRVTMSGFFQQADVDAFLRDVRLKLGQLRCGPTEAAMLTLIDYQQVHSLQIV